MGNEQQTFGHNTNLTQAVERDRSVAYEHESGARMSSGDLIANMLADAHQNFQLKREVDEYILDFEM